METIYPRGELDGQKALLNKLGSFWNYQFADSDLLEVLYRAEADDYEQQYQDYLDALGSLSRQQVPLYKKEWWKPLTFKKSDLGTVDASSIQYGQSGLVYGGGSDYGDMAVTAQFLYPLDTSIASIAVLMNRRSGTTATLIQGIDYKVYSGSIAFLVDPFTDERFAVRPVYDLEGSLVDYEVGLWAFAVDLDQKYIWNHAGYVVGINYATTQAYKDFVNAVWDMHSWGPTTLGLRKAIAGVMGIPIALADSEVVERIFEDSHLFIITDQNVYQFELGANATVAEGDILKVGDTLTDVIEFTELFGNSPDITKYEGIVLGSSLLKDSYLGSLYFLNDDVPLEYVEADSVGYVDVRFSVSGFPLDVTAFWETVHARGVAQGATLAHLLDTRTGGNGEPLPQNLPSTINPMEVITEVIGANFMLVRVRTSLTAPGAPGVHALGAVRNILPPGMGVILYVAIEAPQETYASSSVTDGVITSEYGVTAPAAILTVNDLYGFSYVMVNGDFVLVDNIYVVIGCSSVAEPESYGHLVPTLRQIATDCD